MTSIIFYKCNVIISNTDKDIRIDKGAQQVNDIQEEEETP